MQQLLKNMAGVRGMSVLVVLESRPAGTVVTFYRFAVWGMSDFMALLQGWGPDIDEDHNVWFHIIQWSQVWADSLTSVAIPH